MIFKKGKWACLIAIFTFGWMAAGQALADSDEEPDSKKWEEVQVQLPLPFKKEDLLPFYVSASTDNRFFVDPASISVGSDGVVRYTLVVTTSNGVTNVSFEGMRCDTKERRLYAFGRADGTWSKSRNDQWVKIIEATSNRHHAALFLEYFCPDGVIIRNAEEAKRLLQQGGYTGRSRG